LMSQSELQMEIIPQPDTHAVQTDGTTIIAVKYDGGVMLGADGRSANNMYVGNKVSDKLEPIHQRIYC